MCGSRGENARPQINNRRVPRYRSLPHRFVLNQRSHQGCRNREFARAPSTAAGPERDRFQQPHDEAPPSEQTRQIVCVIFVHIVLRYYNRETAWCEGKPPVSTASLSALTLMSTRRLNTMCAPSGKPWLHSSFLAMRYKPRANSDPAASPPKLHTSRARRQSRSSSANGASLCAALQLPRSRWLFPSARKSAADNPSGRAAPSTAMPPNRHQP